MGAEEPLSNREILDRFEGIRRNQEAADTRISNSVSTEVWARENGHIQRDIAEVDAHCEERHKITMKALDEVKSAMGEMKRSSEQALAELKRSSEKGLGELRSSIEKRSEFTWQRVLAVASILAVLAAAWYTALHQGGH